MSFYGGSRLPFDRLETSPNAPAAPRGRGRPVLQLQQVPEAVSVSFYGGSRLPFDRLANSPNALLQLPEAAADLSCSSNKSLRPCQCPFMEVPGCRSVSFYGGSRLPFDRLENSPNASAAPRGRGRPFLQLQQVPEAVSVSFYGGSRLPFSVFLWRFKAAV